MVRLEKHGDSAVRFIFTDSDHYLYKDGVVDVPVNSLSLVIDESEMVTFKKASTADPFISFRLDKSNFSSRDELLAFYKENMVGAGGISEEEVQEMIDAATSGIPSSQVIEALRSDLNTVSGEVENKQDALQFYGEDTDQWEEQDPDAPDSTAVFTQKHSDIYIEDSGDEGNSQACVQTRVDTVKFNGVLDTGQSASLVNIYANEMSNETTEYGSSIEVSDNGVGIKSSFIDYDDESSQRLASINMNHNDASISLESTVNENGTVMVINPSGVTINDERVLTEGDVDNALNSGSTNPVQNAVITQALDAKADASAITSIESDITAVSNDLNTLSGAVIDNEYTVSQAINSLNNRVTAVESGGTGGGITSGDVQTMIDDSLDIYWTSAQTQTAIDGVKVYYVDFDTLMTTGIHDADWDGLLAAINAHRPIIIKGYGVQHTLGSAYHIINGDNEQIILSAADSSEAYEYIFTKNGSEDYSFNANNNLFVSQAEKNTWNAKQDALSAGTGIEISGNVISATGGGGMDDDTQQLISTAFNDLNDRKADLTELSKYQKKGDYVETSTLADYMTNDAFDEYATAKERIISGALNDLDNRMIAVESGGSVTVDTTLDSGSTNPVQNAVITQALNAKADTSAITTAITSGSTDSEIPTAKAVYDATQSGGGGATYSAGTNISIDTANTINCTLPITGNNSSIIMTGASNSITADNRFSQVFGTGNIVNAYGGYQQYCITVEGINNSCGTQATHVEGGYNQGIYGSYSHVEGAHNKLEISISPYDEVCSHVEGKYNKVLNYSEHASGQYNNSVSVSTTFGDGGNTLFSVGNGTSDSARHNAFEIRQNGDIYVNDGTNDVKLQDTITATTANTTALGGLKLVKLTQAEYDALATKDSSTLYIISD